MEEKSDTITKSDHNLENLFKPKIASYSNSKDKAKLDINIKNKLNVAK